jgi:predicted PolB exonuclease-like 3'-5' exonuclease
VKDEWDFAGRIRTKDASIQKPIMKHIVFDIETIPQDEARLLALAPEFTAPANLKDPEKIAAAIAKKRADYIADAALGWKTAEVVLICAGDDTQIQSFTADTEKELVGNFLALLGDALADSVAVGGHNVKGFDLPMLVNRARVHGLNVPTTVLSFWKGRPTWHESIFDTLELLSFGRAFEGNGVEEVARVFGLPPKLGHGGDFPMLWRADREAALAYNRRDVEIEVEIARICGCI